MLVLESKGFLLLTIFMGTQSHSVSDLYGKEG